MAIIGHFLKSILPTLGGVVSRAVPFLGHILSKTARAVIPAGITGAVGAVMNKVKAPPELTSQVVDASQNLGQQLIANRMADSIAAGSDKLGSFISNAISKRAQGGIDNSQLLLNNFYKMADFIRSSGPKSFLRDGITGLHMGSEQGQEALVNRMLNPTADLAQISSSLPQ